MSSGPIVCALEIYLPETILGKALGTLEKGSGVVYALAKLQQDTYG